MRIPLLSLCCVALVLFPPAAWSAEPAFELHDGDRVVLLGDAFIERDQAFGELELALATRWPDRRVVFRNLGWSGDNVFGRSRAGFGAPATDPSEWIPPSPQTEHGFKQLREQVLETRPTVIFVAYGATESYADDAGLAQFAAGYRTLLDALAETKARFVLLSPLPVEKLGPPLPDPAADNARRQKYAAVIREIAAERGARFVDLFALLGPAMSASGGAAARGNAASLTPALSHGERETLTDNGIHLNARGYRVAAQALAKGLGWTPVSPPESGPQRAAYEQLRGAILAKNELYFHRWRPANNTYLFLFRKHEQGQNAKEIPMFDPLVAEREQEIAKLLEAAR
ncbi:MAG: SGNH/GDSL hydrolase family protein [Pirellulales bacterium]